MQQDAATTILKSLTKLLRRSQLSPKSAHVLEDRLRDAEEHIREIRAFVIAREKSSYATSLLAAVEHDDAGTDADELLKRLKST